MFEYLNQFSGRKWWSAVEIGGIVMMILSLIVALPCIDMFYDPYHSNFFGAGQIVGRLFDPDDPIRLIVFGRWTVSDEQSNWLFVIALFSLSFGGRTGELMLIFGAQYRRGMVCKLVRPHWLLPTRVWVKAGL